MLRRDRIVNGRFGAIYAFDDRALIDSSRAEAVIRSVLQAPRDSGRLIYGP